MVHFTRYGSAGLFHSPSRFMHRCMRVTPFGHPRITTYVPFPAAFRSLSRPSSPCGSTGIRHRPIFRLTILSFPPRDSGSPRGQRSQSSSAPRTRLLPGVRSGRLPAAQSAFFPFSLPVKDLKILSTFVFRILWNGIELNYRPPPYQSGALTN